MNDLESWLYLDGPEPELLRPTLEALSDPMPTPEEEERIVRGALAKVDAELSSSRRGRGQSSAPGGAEPAPSTGASGPVLLDDAEVESAPPTPGAPALQEEEEKEEEKPVAPLPAVVRAPAFLTETSQSPEDAAVIRAAVVAAAVRPAPEVRVAGAQEHSRTQKLPVMDPSQGTRRPPPDLTLQQYVAYRTELELWPEHSADFHRKHGVESEAAYQELVRLWEGRLAASPHVRAQAEGIRASCLEQARTMLRARSGA